MIESNDIKLDKPKFEDWKSIYDNLWSHEESSRYMLWKISNTEEEAKIRMRKNINFMNNEKECYFVYEKKKGQAIGFAGMKLVSDGIYQDTGIAIGPSYIGKGYGKQILNCLVKRAFTHLSASQFICSCRRENIPSKHMIQSCGFQYSSSVTKVDPRTGLEYILDTYVL